MYPRKILFALPFACAFLQIAVAQNNGEPSGFQKFTTAAREGTAKNVNDAFELAASGVDLGTSTISNKIKLAKSATDTLKNIQDVSMDSFNKVRTAAGKLGTSVSDLGTNGLTGLLEKSADGVKNVQDFAKFGVDEAEKIGKAGGKAMKSVVSNYSGAIVNSLNGVDKVATKTGEIREVMADGLSSTGDASADLLKEGISTVKTAGVAGLKSLSNGLKDIRMHMGQSEQTVSPTTDKNVKPGGSSGGWSISNLFK